VEEELTARQRGTRQCVLARVTAQGTPSYPAEPSPSRTCADQALAVGMPSVSRELTRGLGRTGQSVSVMRDL